MSVRAAALADLTGAYQLSRRNAAAPLGDVLGVDLSLGTISNVEGKVCKAPAQAHAQALARVRQAKVKYLDATSCAQADEPRSLGTFASRLATVLLITTKATIEDAREGATAETAAPDAAAQKRLSPPSMTRTAPGEPLWRPPGDPLGCRWEQTTRSSTYPRRVCSRSLWGRGLR